jgi:hypothetical protein
MATKEIVSAAAAPCLPASVACMGITVLLSVCRLPRTPELKAMLICSSYVPKLRISVTYFLRDWTPFPVQFVAWPSTKSFSGNKEPQSMKKSGSP